MEIGNYHKCEFSSIHVDSELIIWRESQLEMLLEIYFEVKHNFTIHMAVLEFGGSWYEHKFLAEITGCK